VYFTEQRKIKPKDVLGQTFKGPYIQRRNLVRRKVKLSVTWSLVGQVDTAGDGGRAAFMGGEEKKLGQLL